MIKNTKEDLSYLLDNRRAGVEYVAALDDGGDSTEYISLAVRPEQGQTAEDYSAKEEELKAYIMSLCYALYEVNAEGMKKLWQNIK